MAKAMKNRNTLFIIAAVIVLSYWIIEAVVDSSIFFSSQTFLDLVSFDLESHELYSRFLFICVTTMFALIVWVLYGRIEKEHKQSESDKKSLATTLNSIGDAVISTDNRGIVVGLNPVAEKIIGCTSFDAIGSHINDVFNIVNEMTGEKVPNPVEKVLRDGRVVGMANHTALISREGIVYSIADSGSPIRDENGEIIGVVLVFRDVTEERNAHNALATSEQLFRSVIANSQDGLTLQDQDGTVLEWNKSMEQIFGVQRSGAVGRKSWDILDELFNRNGSSPLLSERIKSNLYYALSQGRVDKLNLSVEIDLDFPDGSRKTIEQRHYTVPRGDGSWYLASVYRDITEKKQKEIEISAANERFNKIFTLSPSMIIVNDLQTGRIVEVNDAFEAILKHSREFVVNRITEDLDIWVNHNDRKVWVDQVLKNGGVSEFETQFRNSEGDLLFITLSSALIQIDGRDCIITYAQDISERKRAESKLQKYQVELELRVAERTKELEQANLELEQINNELTREFQERQRIEDALRESEENYRTMIEQLPIGIYRSTVDGILKKANPALASILGFEASDELLDFTVYDFYERDESRIELIEKQSMARGVVREELELRRKDGKKIWVRDTGKVILDENGHVAFTDGVIEDITASKIANEKLKRSEEQYRLLFEKLHDVFFRVGVNGEISVLSPSAEKALGYAPDELTGKPISIIIPDEKFVVRFFDTLKRQRSVNNMTTQARRKDGSIIYLSINAHIFTERKNHFHGVEGIARDITGDIKHQNFLAALYAISKSANSVDSLLELYSSIHESLKTLVEAENFNIAIYEKSKRKIFFPRITDELNEAATEIDSTDKRYLTSQVIREGRTIFMNEKEVSEYYIKNNSPKVVIPKVWIGIPLKVKDEVIGSISVKSYKSENAYSPEDISVLESLSSQIAIAVDRKRAALALKNQFQFMQKLIDTIPNPVYYKDAAHRTYQGCNKAYEETIGFSRDFIIGKTVYDLFPYESALSYEQKDIELITTGGIQNYEDTFLRPNGSVTHHMLFRSCYSSPDGEVGGLVGIILDITDIKLAEEAARQAKEHAEMIYKVTPSCIFTVDKKRHITSWNERVAQLTGYSPEEVVNKICDFCPQYGEGETCALFDTNLSKPIIGLETIITTKNGEKRVISKNIDLLRNSLGQVIGGIESFEDITDRKRIESALFWEASANSAFAELSKLIISAESLVQITDLTLNHGLSLTASRSGFIGVYNRENGMMNIISFNVSGGQSIDNLDTNKPKLSGDMLDWLAANRRTVLINDSSEGRWSEMIQDSGMQIDRIIFSPAMFGEEMLGQIAIANSYNEYNDHDVEVAERLASLLAVAIQRMRAQNEMQLALDKEHELNEMKSSFISMVSHEYRTPLQAIVMSTQLLSDYGEKLNEESRLKYFEIISKSVKTMDTLLEDIITYNSIEGGKVDFLPTNIDVEKFCLNFAYEMQYFAKDKCKIDLTVNNGNCIASMDEKIIRQALTNIISNAIKYSKDGDTVELVVNVFDNEIEFVVRDFGIGIHEDDQRRIFEPFFRGKNVGASSGTGLGLAIARNTINSHGGSISFESKPGAGTAFFVRIPFFESVKISK